MGLVALPKKSSAKKNTMRPPLENFFFLNYAGHPCYQMPEPSRRMLDARLSVCATARWCRPLLIASTTPTVNNVVDSALPYAITIIVMPTTLAIHSQSI